jgi:hypothetical protein
VAGGDFKDHLPGWYRDTDEQMLGVLQGLISRQGQEQDDRNRNS